MRTTAGNWLEMAEKVWAYRRDLLSDPERKELRNCTEALRSQIKQKADAAQLKLSIEALEPVLQRLGGKIYPKTALIDNVEFFLVAAIVILGFRAFIAQPFKIPTNSMWPSYYGMTVDNLLVKGEDPGAGETALRFVTKGAFRHEVSSAVSGELTFKVQPNGRLAYTIVNGRKWLLIPTQYRQYSFNVGGAEYTTQIPLEYSDFDSVVYDSIFGGEEGFREAWEKAVREKKLEPTVVRARENSADMYRAYVLHTGKQIKAGQDVLRFDILTGDQLFVDRVSYHFVAPSAGDGFVFKTGNIAGIGMDQYYIKRLVGVPGDVLEIKEPVLYRNGKPITGALAFENNAKREAPFKGYLDATTASANAKEPWTYLRRGETLTVPENNFFALGDNSANSADGRDWGFVPAKDVIGRPLFTYFPFTNRVGGKR